MFEVSFGRWNVVLATGELPALYNDYKSHAAMAEEFALKDTRGTACFVAVRGDKGTGDLGWSELVIAQRYEPDQWGFIPGALIAPETAMLFVGAGARLLAYDLSKPMRLWEDQADCGFWRWRQHGKIVLMSAELELAAWSTLGEKLWSNFVEPPWYYGVEGETIELDVMGRKSRFEISAGPNAA